MARVKHNYLKHVLEMTAAALSSSLDDPWPRAAAVGLAAAPALFKCLSSTLFRTSKRLVLDSIFTFIDRAAG